MTGPQNPQKSFKFDRKSEFAIQLKSHISDHLLHFCPDYNDPILAEYITVLVCNGKNQIQAIHYLEAFLGKKTQEFVSWLWKLLVSNELQFTVGISADETEKASNHSDKNRENVNTVRESTEPHNSGHCVSGNLEGKYNELKVSSCQDFMMPSKDCLKEIIESPTQASVARNKLARVDMSRRRPLSVRNHESGIVDAAGKTASLVQKNLSVLPRRVEASALERRPASGLRNCPWDKLSGSASQRSLPSIPLKPSYTDKPRQSVWDRLGKPLDVVHSKGQHRNFRVMNRMLPNEQQLDNIPPCTHNLPEQTSQLPPLLPRPEQIGQVNPMPAGQVSRRLRQGYQSAKDGSSSKIDDTDRTASQVLSVSNIGRKRHFGAEANIATGDRAKKQFGRVNQSSEQPAAPQTIFGQVLAVGKQLRQVEMEIAKLRSKQKCMGEKTDLLMSSGLMKPQEGDNDSRTVVVNNVHNKATKETLSKYFQRCGAIASVDIVPGENIDLSMVSDRSAYISFDKKEAAEKALAYSGASFYSRTILVKRIGEVTGATPSPAQIGSRTVLNSVVNPDSVPISGSHQQLRMESTTLAPTEPPTSDKTLGTSVCQERTPDLSVTGRAVESKKHLSSSSDQMG